MPHICKLKLISSTILLLTIFFSLPVLTVGIAELFNKNILLGSCYFFGVMLFITTAIKIISQLTPNWPKWMFQGKVNK